MIQLKGKMRLLWSDHSGYKACPSRELPLTGNSSVLSNVCTILVQILCSLPEPAALKVCLCHGCHPQHGPSYLVQVRGELFPFP